MSEKFSGGLGIRELIAVVAGPILWSDNRETWLARAARHAGITCRQAKSLYYGEIADPDHRSARLLRDAAERNAKREARGLAEKFESIAAGLAASDPDFHRDAIAALVSGARALRGLDRAGGVGS